MDNKIQKKIKQIKKNFEIPEIPGNLFEIISDYKYFEKYGLLIFKEDIGKLSGFIAYPNQNMVIICINYKRPLGHQNFTIAHELGHYFLHSKENKDDNEETLFNDNDTLSYDTMEKEANIFAAELLYPQKKFEEDYKERIEKLSCNKNITIELCDIIDKLCHKYCVSFEFVLGKVCKKENIKLEQAQNEVKKLTNGIAQHYDLDFYGTSSVIYNKKYEKPYELLKEGVEGLLKNKKINKATAESILYSNGIECDRNNELFG